MNIWFTSDNHFSHTNVIKYCKRPFTSVEEMNETMIQNWNSLVKAGDQIYHLGDFALCKADEATKIVRRLSGQKFMVWGNHDKYTRKDSAFVGHWAWNRDLTEIKINDLRVVLCHFAMKTWNKSHYGAYQLHGHSHGSLKDDPGSLQLDVGVDCWDYRPVNLDEIVNRMAAKTFTPIDHHQPRAD